MGIPLGSKGFPGSTSTHPGSTGIPGGTGFLGGTSFLESTTRNDCPPESVSHFSKHRTSGTPGRWFRKKL